MAIEHRELRKPVLIQRDAPLSPAFINNLVERTPSGDVLAARQYTYRLPEEHEVAILTVLRNGHGLLRQVADTEDLTTIRDRVRPAFIRAGGDQEAVLDGIPDNAQWLRVKHLFIYTPGYSPIRTTPRAALRGENRLP